MGSESGSSSLDEITLRDEILESTYWMLHEEGIATTIQPADLVAFLDATGETLDSAFDRLHDDGLFERTGDGYELTDRGEYEAKRRFADTFGHMDETHSHVECGPDCWCHDPDADDDDVCTTAATGE